MDKTLSNLLSNRNFLIGLIIVVVVILFGWGFFSNSKENSSENNKKEEQKQEQTISTNSSEQKSAEKSENIVSLSPESGSQVELAKAPSQVSIKTNKEMTAGSEIKVVSEKGVDVVTAGNKLTVDLKTLSAPVTIEAAGTYTVTYHINWAAGGSKDGSYKFIVK